MIGALPKALTVNGKIYSIYSDYRVALLIFSMCNDDNTDNYFYNKKVGRFPAIDEDEEPYRLLCNEYPEVL